MLQLTLLLVLIGSSNEATVKIEVDHDARLTLQQWYFRKPVEAIRVTAPNLEFAFYVNGKLHGKWFADKSLSKGYTNDEYRKTNYDFRIVVVSQKRTVKEKHKFAVESRVVINTRKALSVFLDGSAVLAVNAPDRGVWFSDGEWFKKKKPWTVPLGKRENGDLITIWRLRLANYANGGTKRKVDNPPTIELVARPVR